MLGAQSLVTSGKCLIDTVSANNLLSNNTHWLLSACLYPLCPKLESRHPEPFLGASHCAGLTQSSQIPVEQVHSLWLFCSGRESCSHSLHLAELALRLGALSSSSLAQGTGLATANIISRAIEATSGPLQRARSHLGKAMACWASQVVLPCGSPSLVALNEHPSW